MYLIDLIVNVSFVHIFFEHVIFQQKSQSSNETTNFSHFDSVNSAPFLDSTASNSDPSLYNQQSMDRAKSASHYFLFQKLVYSHVLYRNN